MTIRVFGTPKAQPRARAFARNVGGRIITRMYDPASAEGWKGEIAIAARVHAPPAPLEGPIRLDVTLYFKRPKRLTTKRFPRTPMRHDVKPDRDNCDKAVMDALTALGFWRDDCQVCAGSVEKWWEGDGFPPGAIVSIEILPDDMP